MLLSKKCEHFLSDSMYPNNKTESLIRFISIASINSHFVSHSVPIRSREQLIKALSGKKWKERLQILEKSVWFLCSPSIILSFFFKSRSLIIGDFACHSIPGSEQFFSSVSLSGFVAINRLPHCSTPGCPSTVIPWPATEKKTFCSLFVY